jgi:cytochrome c-type biogenesis protein CcmH/NrfF
MRPLAIAVAALALAVALGMFLAYRGPDPNETPTSREVQNRVMSPFCPGVLLADCTSSESAALRQRIEDRIDKGWTNRQIDSWLIDEYGRNVLARPNGLLALAVPVSMLFIGAALIAYVALRRRTPVQPQRVTEVSDYHDQITAEMQTLARSESE